MNRLKEHQRKVQATIEAQIKAGARARSGLKDSRGRSVEPVLKVRVPMFDSMPPSRISQANQQPVQRRPPPSLHPQPLQRSSVQAQEPKNEAAASGRPQISMTESQSSHQNQNHLIYNIVFLNKNFIKKKKKKKKKDKKLLFCQFLKNQKIS